ncbi:tryptophan 7-halogenase [Aurantiacibacter suaedae]|uniref:tryptophan 7-halogenase n=1 Tax=Aurantiacibacter suaedae TaxID=2545755 RepID=UPI003BAA7EA6
MTAPLVNFNHLLDIPEAELMRAAQATFKLGIAFENWKDVGQSYFPSFGGALAQDSLRA